MKLIRIFAFALFFAGSAWAANYETLDSNKDGVISADEATKDADLNRDFLVIDKNQDGKLDQAEFALFEALPATEESEAAMPKDSE